MRVLVPLFLALWPVCAIALSAEHDPRLSIAHGAFCQIRSIGQVDAPGTVAEKIELLPDAPAIQWLTHQVPALPGVSFGVRSLAPDGTEFYPVLIELTHPPFHGSGATQQRYVTELGGVEPSINAYSFDTLDELVPGTWTFRAWHDGALLYRVTFDVLPAHLLPGIGRDCLGGPLS